MKIHETLEEFINESDTPIRRPRIGEVVNTEKRQPRERINNKIATNNPNMLGTRVLGGDAHMGAPQRKIGAPQVAKNVSGVDEWESKLQRKLSPKEIIAVNSANNDYADVNEIKAVMLKDIYNELQKELKYNRHWNNVKQQYREYMDKQK